MKAAVEADARFGGVTFDRPSDVSFDGKSCFEAEDTNLAPPPEKKIASKVYSFHADRLHKL